MRKLRQREAQQKTPGHLARQRWREALYLGLLTSLLALQPLGAAASVITDGGPICLGTYLSGSALTVTVQCDRTQRP